MERLVMLHIIEDSVMDCLKLIPFLFLAYFAMEYLEHKTGTGVQRLLEGAGNRLAPVIGGLLGIVPQCGFSAAASNLYAGRVITLGTLMAVYLSTSDEMLPILISEQAPAVVILKILFAKAAIGIIAGCVIDFIPAGNEPSGCLQTFGDCREGQRPRCLQHCKIDIPLLAAGSLIFRRKGVEKQAHIHDICEQEQCHCEKGIFRSALSHTVQIAFFIFVVTFALELVLHYVGEDALANLILNRPVLGPLLAGIVGLIPNCAGSVVITQLYLEGAMGLGAAMAGLLTGSGVGLLVLCRVNHNRRENLKILGLLFCIGVVAGIVIEFVW